MEIKMPEERVLLLNDQLDDIEAEKIAWNNKTNAFGTFHQFSSFLSRPKDEDFVLTYKEHRYLPFLHIKSNAKYVYDRTVSHEWSTSGSEVVSIVLNGIDYKTNELILILKTIFKKSLLLSKHDTYLTTSFSILLYYSFLNNMSLGRPLNNKD
jgi:hypothetical protein